MDWQWFATAIAIPASIAIWKLGEKLLAQWGQVRIAALEAEAKAGLESQKDEREHKQMRESLELATVLGNQSFKDEQITAMAAEAQGETQAFSEFFRGQYAALIEKMVTRQELETLANDQEELIKRVVTIDTYLRSIIQELRDDRRRAEREAREEYQVTIDELRAELEALKARRFR